MHMRSTAHLGQASCMTMVLGKNIGTGMYSGILHCSVFPGLDVGTVGISSDRGYNSLKLNLPPQRKFSVNIK